jgi:hypothetical protein
LLPNFNKVLVVGGDNSVDPSTAELYAPTANSWQKVFNNLNSPRIAHTATLLPDGRVLITGGMGVAKNAPSPSVSTAEIFDPGNDPANGSWSLVSPMNDARAFHTATLLPTGEVLVTGGTSDGWASGGLSSAELFDPVSGSWSRTSAMNSARAHHTATLLSFDLSLQFVVLVAGGMRVFNGDPDNSAELYYPPPPVVQLSPLLVASPTIIAGTSPSPDGSSWVQTGSMNVSRYDHTATAFFGGISSFGVLVTGGGDAGLELTAEVYDSATASWTLTGSIHSARVRHTATTLAGGKLLLAGGGDNSAELGSGCNATAQIVVSPETHDFGEVLAGMNAFPVGPVIQNTGNATLTVTATISGPDAALFGITSPIQVGPNANLPCLAGGGGDGAATLGLFFRALSPTPKTCAATLTLHDSNAVNVPPGTTWIFPLTAQIIPNPYTAIKIEGPSFPVAVVVGDMDTRNLVITLESGEGDGAAIVRFPLPPPDAFFTWDAGDYILDQSQRTISVPIDFTPRGAGPVTELLELISNAQGSPHQVLLRGRGKLGEVP